MYKTNEINNEEILFILNNLREEDKIECETLRGENWKKQIFNDLSSSSSEIILAKTKKNDVPVLIGGAWKIDKNNPQIGCVWLLSTPEIAKHKICFLRGMKKEIERFDEKFSLLFNKIYIKNEFAKSWLKYTGFRFPQTEKVQTPLDKAFRKIEVPKDFEIFYRERPVKGLGE